MVFLGTKTVDELGFGLAFREIVDAKLSSIIESTGVELVFIGDEKG